MAKNLTQEEIFALTQELEAEIAGGIKPAVSADHLLICVNCRKIIRSNNPDVHHIYSLRKCPSGQDHMFVSEKWLRDKKRNPVYGWQRPYPIGSEPKEFRIPKRVIAASN